MAGRDATHPDDADRDRSLAWLGAAGGSPRILAEIWATVELERAVADLGHPEPGGDGLWSGLDGAVIEDPLLGARVAVAEASTEGRLAATLARHGEGRAGRYIESPVGLEELRVLAAAAGVTLSRAENGPFGPSVLVVASVAGPHLILVDPGQARADRAAVPSPP